VIGVRVLTVVSADEVLAVGDEGQFIDSSEVWGDHDYFEKIS
jgi:hypothetical protein